MKRLWRYLDNLVFKDELETIDRPEIPLETRMRFSNELDRLNRRFGFNAFFVEKVLRLMRTIPTRPVRIVDVGAGNAGLLMDIYKRALRAGIAVELTGLEYAAETVRFVQEPLTRRGYPITMKQGDASQLGSIPDNAYDIVISGHMVHHVRQASDVASFFKDVYRIAKHGWVILDFERRFYAPLIVRLNRLTFGIGIWGELFDAGVKSVRRAYTSDEINAILADTPGLAAVMSCKSYPVLPYWKVEGQKRPN